VVRDISFGVDDDVIAGTNGRWELEIALDEGANELTFRIGDDDSSEIKLGLTYEPEIAAGSPPPPSATPAEEPATDEPSAETEETEPAPEPAPEAAIIEEGTWEVGTDIKAGTYRTREPVGTCYWARLKGFDGDLDDIIANDLVVGYGIVTISKKDVGFETNGCEWSSDLSRVTESNTQFDDGTYIVGRDIKAGKYRAPGGEGCYWARLKGFGGTLGQIITNDVSLGGRVIATIRSSDKGFVTRGCGTWKKG
jgi:hypothetical protein